MIKFSTFLHILFPHISYAICYVHRQRIFFYFHLLKYTYHGVSTKFIVWCDEIPDKMFFNCHPQYTPSYHYRQFSSFSFFILKALEMRETEFMLAIQWTCWNIIWILFLLHRFWWWWWWCFLQLLLTFFLFFSNFPHFWTMIQFFA